MRPTERDATAFGERLDVWIKAQEAHDPFKRRVTQTHLARLFGVSTSAISNWKLGHEVPSMNSLLTIAQKTGIPFEELARLVQFTIAARGGEELAVATGDESDAELARQADEQAATARAATDDAVRAMKETTKKP